MIETIDNSITPKTVQESYTIDSNESIETKDKKDWESLMSDDIMIKTVVTGDGSSAEVGTVVKCNYDCYLVDPETKARQILMESISDQCFKVGEGDCVPGLELALRHTKNGSELFVRCSSKFAYGFIGRPAYGSNLEIPPNSSLEYHVKDVQFVDYSNLTPLQTSVEEVKLRKDIGNRWFSSKDYNRAGRAYSKGIQIAEGALNGINEESMKSDEANLLQDLYLTCMNNLAATYISTSEFVKAKETCIRVLEIQPMNSKALLRASKAALALDEYEECEACLNRLGEIDPGNVEVPKERLKLKQAKKVYRESSRKMAERMSKKLFEPSSSSSSSLSSSLPTSSSSDEFPVEMNKEIPSKTVKTDSPSNNYKNNDKDDVNETTDISEDIKSMAHVDTSILSSFASNSTIKTSENKQSNKSKEKSNIKLNSNSSTLQSRHTVLFLVTSIVVIIASVVIVYLINKQPQSQSHS